MTSAAYLTGYPMSKHHHIGVPSRRVGGRPPQEGVRMAKMMEDSMDWDRLEQDANGEPDLDTAERLAGQREVLARYALAGRGLAEAARATTAAWAADYYGSDAVADRLLDLAEVLAAWDALTRSEPPQA